MRISQNYVTLERGTNYENVEIYYHITYYQGKVLSENEIFTRSCIIQDLFKNKFKYDILCPDIFHFSHARNDGFCLRLEYNNNLIYNIVKTS